MPETKESDIKLNDQDGRLRHFVDLTSAKADEIADDYAATGYNVSKLPQSGNLWSVAAARCKK